MRRARDDKHDDRNDDHDDDDDVPLHHRRPFGAGLKRQRVEFVRAADPDAGINVSEPAADAAPSDAGPSVEDIYAAIVLKSSSAAGHKKDRNGGAASTPNADGDGAEADKVKDKDTESESVKETLICPVCALPITASQRQHELSLAHQVSLAHSHPPSALDRSRMGLRALESQGWDPDSRRGLGRDGEGMRFPVKTVLKEDTLGIGAASAEKNKKKESREKGKEKTARSKPLTAKERKAFEEKERRRAERLQAEIFGRIDVEKYLRGS
ncbi:G patch domain and ankyrin repeat-containing protein 1 -like protein [Escovopsis weberi]|uniref:G patch domain and ankyrin repeat-containing protein 1-like protein n=1 Tax=Escovopsis weberi TaxID=150374 RepID=A0A0N0RU76_ESCWE|nr:G patch domain and ankyrin repeat-containing protein 1 -like protein [Escovopsis weberi]